MRLNKKVGYGEYVPPISYDSLKGDLEGAFSNHTTMIMNYRTESLRVME